MLHYDASASDAGALSWLADPACKVSYNAIVLDDGSWTLVVPWTYTAYHAGECRPSSEQFEYHQVGTSYRHTANHGFYGISIASNDVVGATAAAMLTVAYLCRTLFQNENWSAVEDGWRITTHEAEAWPRGRKSDPTGPTPKNPILGLGDVRWLLPRLSLTGD